MAVRVVLAHGRHHGFRRLRRAAWTVIGALLLGAAILASLVAVPLGFGLALLAVLLAQSSGSGVTNAPDIPWGQLLQVVGISMAIMIVTGFAGVHYLRGKRGLILFLRRFGYDDATKAISIAAASSMGGTWRLVTLDDSEVAPLGLTTPTRLAVRAGDIAWTALRTLIGGTLGLFRKAVPIAFGAVIAIPFIDTFSRQRLDLPATLLEYDRILVNLVGKQRLPALQLDLHLAFVIALAIATAGIAAYVLIVVGVIAMMGLLVPMSTFMATAQGLDRAERDKRFTIGEATTIEMVARTIAYESAGMFAPRLIVVKVPSAMWRPAVRRFADLSAAALIDISEPTESLLWEIAQLKEIAAKTVLVGEHEHVLPLADTGTSPSGSITRRLAAMIDGHEVLAYTRDRPGMRRFARELSDALETAAG